MLVFHTLYGIGQSSKVHRSDNEEGEEEEEEEELFIWYCSQRLD